MEAKLSKRRKDLLKELERTIGKCHNPYSTTVTAIEWGRDYNVEEGRWFKYPVSWKNKAGQKTKSPISLDPGYNDNPNDKVLLAGFYAFGANELPIFYNLNRILGLLEAKYGLVIDEPEQPHPQRGNGPKI